MFNPLYLVKKTSNSITLRWNDFLRQPSINAGEGLSNIITNDGNIIVIGDELEFSQDWLMPPPEATDLIEVASGNEFSVGIKSDGSLVAWGYSPGDDLWESTLLIPSEAVNIKKIAIRERLIIALTKTGQVIAWGGWNDYGERDVPSGLGNIIDIAAGRDFGAALRQDGTTVLWGAWYNGHFAQPTTPYKAIATGDNFGGGITLSGEVEMWTKPAAMGGQFQATPVGLSNVIALSAGPTYIIALKEDGTIAAWGDGYYTTENGAVLTVPNQLTSTTDSGFVKIIKISAGYQHAIALREDGSLVAWGNNSLGGCNVPSNALTSPSSYHIYQDYNTWLSDTTSKTATINNLQPDTDYTFFVTNSNNLNSNPSLRQTFSITTKTGNKNSSLVIAPTNDTELALSWNPFSDIKIKPIKLIAAGDNHSLVCLEGNSLHAWGDNVSNQLTIPTIPNGNIVSIHAHQYKSTVLLESGELISWGGSVVNTIPSGLNGNIVAYAANNQWELALKNDGTVVAWGSGAPDLSDLSNIVKIAIADYHILLLKADGTLVARGDNGDETDIPGGLTGFVADIAAGEHFSLVLKTDGTITAWSSQPSTGFQPNLWIGNNIVKISACPHNYYAIGLKQDGSIVAWGMNIPIEPSFLSSNENQGIVDIVAGRLHAMLTFFDGTVRCFGYSNFYGQLDVPNSDNIGYVINKDNELSLAVNQIDLQSTLSELQPNTEYSIFVAQTVNGETSGNETTTETGLTFLSKPTNVYSPAQTSSSCQLTWDSVLGATTYEIFESGISLDISTPNLLINIPDLISENNYTFAVKAKNLNNESLLSDPVEVLILAEELIPPEAPTNLTLQNISTNSCILSWTAPIAGAPFTYELFLDDVVYTNNVTISDTTATISGLASNTLYNFTVKATNDGGTSPASNLIVALTAPEAPTNLIVSDVTTEGFVLNWTAPSGTGEIVYSIYKNNDIDPYANAVIAGTSATITALNSNTLYNFTIKFTNANGSSSASVSALLLPDAPTGLVANNINNVSVDLSWTAPSGSESLSYLIYQDGSQIATSDTAHVTISSLTGNTSYEFKVAATNNTGNSADSMSINALTIPNKPISFLATNITQSSVTLSWLSPIGGAPNYKVYQDTVLISEQFGLSIDVSGLTSETIYSFVVKASNATGDSYDSNIVAIKTTLAVVGLLCYCDENSTVNEIPLYANPISLPAIAAVADNNITMYSSLVSQTAPNASRLVVSTASGDMAASLTIPAPGPLSFLAMVATNGNADGQVNVPRAMATDPTGNIHLIDSNNHRIQKFDSSFNFIGKYQNPGTEDGQLWSPVGIARDTAGNFYVTDFSSRVQKFDSSFNFLGKFGGTGTTNGKFDFISEIAVDTSGNIYVVDHTTHRVQKFNSSFVYLGKISATGSGNGQLNSPDGVAVSPTGYIYVADSGNHRIQVFSPSLSYVSKFGAYGSGDGQLITPCSVSFDTSGNIYVVEFLGHRVSVFDSNHNFIGKFGAYGLNTDGLFWAPRAVAFDQSGNIYVSNSYGKNIQKFAGL